MNRIQAWKMVTVVTVASVVISAMSSASAGYWVKSNQELEDKEMATAIAAMCTQPESDTNLQMKTMSFLDEIYRQRAQHAVPLTGKLLKSSGEECRSANEALVNSDPVLAKMASELKTISQSAISAEQVEHNRRYQAAYLHFKNAPYRKQIDKIIKCATQVLESKKSTFTVEGDKKTRRYHGEYIQSALTILNSLSNQNITDFEVPYNICKLQAVYNVCQDQLSTLKKIKTTMQIKSDVKELEVLADAIKDDLMLKFNIGLRPATVQMVKDFLVNKIECRDGGVDTNLGIWAGVGAGMGIGVCKDALGQHSFAVVPHYSLATEKFIGANVSFTTKKFTTSSRPGEQVRVDEYAEIGSAVGPTFNISEGTNQWQGVSLGLGGGKIDRGHYPIRFFPQGGSHFIHPDYKGVRKVLGITY